MKRIVSYGGGVNSTAMLVGLTIQGVVVDYILFADTGGEKPETYDYISYFDLWLRSKGQPGITIVRTTDKEGNVISLEADLLKNNTIPPIAFGFKSCSEKFKQRPQNKFLNALPLWNGDSLPIKYIGFDADEERRVKADPDGKYKNEFPLIQWGLNRQGCINLLDAQGVKIPPKSSCFFCPNMKKEEVLSLSDELKNRAIAMEENAQGKLIELKGLGRNYAWKDLIHADRTQLRIFDDVEVYQPPCECID